MKKKCINAINLKSVLAIAKNYINISYRYKEYLILWDDHSDLGVTKSPSDLLVLITFRLLWSRDNTRRLIPYSLNTCIKKLSFNNLSFSNCKNTLPLINRRLSSIEWTVLKFFFFLLNCIIKVCIMPMWLWMNKLLITN